MCPVFDSRTRRHIWVEYVAGSLLRSERLSTGTPVFLSPQKPTILNSNSILECTGISERVLVKSFELPWVNKLHIFIFRDSLINFRFDLA